jgi:hypothetical protein
VSLESVLLGENITNIGFGAFCGCVGLYAIEIPDKVSVIERDVFSGSSLTSLVIGKSVSSIKSGAISNCPLVSIDVDEDNTVYDSR